MTNEDGSCWIVFNGEIYNHRALRSRLIDLGHTFRTSSDTETILHAYEEFGADCVPMFEGMFAFAVYDSRRRELLLARDRLGKKPLFYAELDGALHFASEIKALRASPAWDPALDLSELEGYLSLGYFLAPGTVYRHVRKLLPGHWLRVRNGSVEVRKILGRRALRRSSGRPGRRSSAKSRTCCARRSATGSRAKCRWARFCPAASIRAWSCRSWPRRSGAGVTTTTVGFGEAAHNELDAAGAHGVAVPDAAITSRSSSRGSTRCSTASSMASTSRSPTRPRFRRSTSPAWRSAT